MLIFRRPIDCKNRFMSLFFQQMKIQMKRRESENLRKRDERIRSSLHYDGFSMCNQNVYANGLNGAEKRFIKERMFDPERHVSPAMERLYQSTLALGYPQESAYPHGFDSSVWRIDFVGQLITCYQILTARSKRQGPEVPTSRRMQRFSTHDS